MAGLEHDPENEELKDGRRRATDELEEHSQNDEAKAKFARAMADPELRALLSDPVMEQLLLDFDKNPSAAAAVALMKNPELAAKLQKLADAGM